MRKTILAGCAAAVSCFCGGLSKNASANEHRTLYLDCNS
jgi:hypothetical protein